MLPCLAAGQPRTVLATSAEASRGLVEGTGRCLNRLELLFVLDPTPP